MTGIVVAGLVVVLATGGYALSLRGTDETWKPLPHWGLYTDSSWTKLQSSAAAHRLVPASLDIVTGTRLERNREPFAILGARTTSGRRCFAVARGATVSRVVCRVAAPLTMFTEADTCAVCAPNRTVPLKTLTVLALVRRDVASVRTVGGGRTSNVDRTPAAGGTSAFNASAVRRGVAFAAFSSANRMLSEIHPRPR